jgi:exodeoxyribonuclease VII large subunit
MSEQILSVSEITNEIKLTLENSFSDVTVIGEISNFTAHYSGHWYFTLKDSNSQISCTMWRSLNSKVFFKPQDGMKVIVRGNINVYPPRGSYQINARMMQPAGEGELQAAFERLKRKLAAEGLFDESLKKQIPQFPETIGIVTADGAAALRDLLSVAERRYPIARLIHAPAKVQGEGAAEEIAAAIDALNRYGKVDVIIVGRGGGSLEDLWAFNEEVVARAIFNSKIPVVSGVGHEVDFTIADFVADLRAPTPTAAMELVTPNQEDIFAYLNDFLYTSHSKIVDYLGNKNYQVEQILSSYGFRKNIDFINTRAQYIDGLFSEINNSVSDKIKDLTHRVSLAKRTIDSADIRKNLKKGYSIVKQDGIIITDSEKITSDKNINIQFYENEIELEKWQLKK